jgi:N-acyl-D-amino-acid deacylase
MAGMSSPFGKTTASALGLLAAMAVAQAQTSETFDTVIRNGTVIDGSGAAPYRADVAVLGGHIVRVGDLARASAKTTIDATGLYVVPGFINIHSHPSADALPRAENMLTQGVTTEILNADGGGPLDLRSQMDRLEAAGLAVNVGGYVPFNTIWSTVVGPADRRATAAEIDRMRSLVVDGLAAGGWGVSAGLDYKPAYFADTDEVTAVVSAAGPWRTNFNNHDRVTPETDFSSRAGIAETMKIAAGAGLIPVITHMKVTGAERGTAERIIGGMSGATKSGAYTAADAYPYLAGQTQLGALIIPAWAQDGGRQKMLERFADPALRAKIAAEAEAVVKARFGGLENIFLPATRRQLVDLMREFDAPAGETIIRLLETSNPSAILHFGTEPDLQRILQYEHTSIACDCGATTSTTTHPRNYGSFPRVLGRYVRDQNVLTWQDAVRKMTALPAATVGLVDRGYLAAGMRADITVFDPRTVIDRATYEEPARLSEGVRHVIVNGAHALKDGTVTGVRGGRVLVRSAGMPSRAMPAAAARKAAARGDAGEYDVTLDLVQPAGAKAAMGTVRLTDKSTGRAIQMTDFGVLQAARGWFAITGTGRVAPEGSVRAMTVIVDESDPLVDGKRSITARVEPLGDPRTVDDVVEAEMAKQRIPGVAVAVIRHGQGPVLKGYGLANVEHKVRVTPDTIFQSGSVGKQFTAAAAMTLVEGGRLSLNDTLTKFFPDAPAPWQRITVRHLLTHTSGLPDYTDGTIDYRRDYSEDDLLKFAYSLKLEFEPGARWNYSNTGYVVLGILIHRASGQFYGDVLRQRVFLPLGMEGARIITEADIVPHRASGYHMVRGQLNHHGWVAPRLNTTADGSLYLSLRDMVAWDAGIRNGRVLSGEGWNHAFTPVALNSGKTYPYGFGWMLEPVAGHRSQRHGGSWQGFKADIARYPDDGLTIIVLANLAQADPARISDGIAAVIDPTIKRPELGPIQDDDPEMQARVRRLLAEAAAGKLSPDELSYVRAGFFPDVANAYVERLRDAGVVKGLSLLERREVGDDRIRTYRVAFEKRTMRLWLAVAPDGKLAGFRLTPESDR